ncbi:M20/M25/M40 family metallo-hydrolase [Orrella sp. NBD-18]|uniref:M20/M25/M40 family metallo-hydrolase n=1 Tax=Sheuella amnicola TaxID=2707330 RepID=A0A6B2QXI7_9BURK|nr:glutamate carboxypeptidase [Sheuella amnicola]NDY83366.1 M20/M25/M40 family metallo-hydrolase [Sheuella amnicola]
MKRYLIAGLLSACLSFAYAQSPDHATIRDLAGKTVAPTLKTLQSLVEIESGSRDLAGLEKIRNLIENDLKKLGLTPEVIPSSAPDKTGSMVQAKLKGRGTSKIALIAHMDTVYQKGDLAKQPFRVDGDRAYGLAIADDKAGIAVILNTIAMLQALKIDSFGEITILINGDEEIGSPGSRDRIIQLGEQNDLVISFEGSGIKNDYVRLATSSIARAQLTVKGRASHSGSNPDFGRNALYEMAHQILQMRDLSNPDKGLKLNWTQARAGTVPNMIPSEAVATADVRAEKMSDFDAVEQTMHERIKNKLIPDTEVSLVLTRGRPALNPTDKGRAAAMQAREIASEIGWKIDVLEKATGGGTDAAYAALKSKGAVIESFGLQGFGAHSDNAEYVLVSSIQPRLYMTTRMIQSFKP